MTPKKLPTRLHVAFVGLLAVAFIGLGTFGVWETLGVLRSQSVATARVTESREMLTRHGLSYEVRYVFSPAAGSPEIRRSDFLGRSDLWSSLPEADWKKAVDSQLLQIRFDPSHPGNNAPVQAPPSIWDSITPLVLGGVLLLIVVGVERLRRKQSTHHDDGMPQTVHGEQVVAPNRSLPPTLNSTSSVRGSGDF